MASQISTVIQGKDKPTYTPYCEDGDMCIVLNAKDICVTGRKLTDKFYRWHTGQVMTLSIIVSCLLKPFTHDLLSVFFFLDIELCLSYRYIGHLKERSLKDQMAKDPTEVIRKAVLRMLPRNKLRDVSCNLYFVFLVWTQTYGTDHTLVAPKSVYKEVS